MPIWSRMKIRYSATLGAVGWYLNECDLFDHTPSDSNGGKMTLVDLNAPLGRRTASAASDTASRL
jgi:hypothetical protein